MSRAAEYEGTIVNYKDQFSATKKLRVVLDSRDREIAELNEAIKGKDIRIATLEAQVFELKEQVRVSRGRAASFQARFHELQQGKSGN
jgi:hypothetical protein